MHAGTELIEGSGGSGGAEKVAVRRKRLCAASGGAEEAGSCRPEPFHGVRLSQKTAEVLVAGPSHVHGEFRRDQRPARQQRDLHAPGSSQRRPKVGRSERRASSSGPSLRFDARASAEESNS